MLQASPGHPLADGRLLGTIVAGDSVDGATVTSATLEPYDGGFTYDLLPDGPTGVYLADGIPARLDAGAASSLARAPKLVLDVARPPPRIA